MEREGARLQQQRSESQGPLPPLCVAEPHGLWRAHRVAELRDEHERAGTVLVAAGLLQAAGLIGVVIVVLSFFTSCWGVNPALRDSDWPAAFTVSGCPNASHCGTFARAEVDFACGCAPAYTLAHTDLGAPAGTAALYRQGGRTSSLWLLGSECDAAAPFLRSGVEETAFSGLPNEYTWGGGLNISIAD